MQGHIGHLVTSTEWPSPWHSGHFSSLPTSVFSELTFILIPACLVVVHSHVTGSSLTAMVPPIGRSPDGIIALVTS